MPVIHRSKELKRSYLFLIEPGLFFYLAKQGRKKLSHVIFHNIYRNKRVTLIV